MTCLICAEVVEVEQAVAGRRSHAFVKYRTGERTGKRRHLVFKDLTFRLETFCDKAHSGVEQEVSASLKKMEGKGNLKCRVPGKIDQRSRINSSSHLSDIAEVAADCIWNKGKCLLLSGYTLTTKTEAWLILLPKTIKTKPANRPYHPYHT
jgi:hypothetical protein